MRASRVLADSVRGAWAWYGTYALAGLVCAAAALVLPALLESAADEILAGTGQVARLWAIAAPLTADAAGTCLASVAKNSAVARSARRLRANMVRSILAAGPLADKQIAAGDLSGRVGAGVSIVSEAPYLAINLAIALLTSAGALVALALVTPYLVLVFVAAIPAAALVTRQFAGRGERADRLYLDHAGSTAALLAEAMHGARTIRASHSEERELERVLSVLPALSAAGLSSWRIHAETSWRIVSVGAISQIAVLAIATARVLAGHLRPSELVAVAGYALLASSLPAGGGYLTEAWAAAERVAEVLDLRPLRSLSEPGDPGRYAAAHPASAGLAIRDLTVQRGERAALSGISCDVPPGTTLAVVGPSGSGKSTLAEAIAGLCPIASGSVSLGGAPLGPGDVAMAFARPVLFGETIRDCLTFGRPEATDEELRRAVRTAGVDHMIDRMPLGLLTPLAGLALSGGEIQRLGLARSLLRDSRLLILDDAMLSLDSITLARVQQALEEGRGARTSRIVISASPRVLGAADAVLWLDSGTVRAIGTHRELSRHPEYRVLLGLGRGQAALGRRSAPCEGNA